jgi:hypothetical protein
MAVLQRNRRALSICLAWPAGRIRREHAKLILVIVIAGFGVLHLIAEGVLRHGPGYGARRPTAEVSRPKAVVI